MLSLNPNDPTLNVISGFFQSSISILFQSQVSKVLRIIKYQAIFIVVI